mmetsp:Transcript_30952/g.66473  ORF Transcript_30952/g.66473 Transcript_30952/m.66473 type:complete len:94 (+) Transcript_30952:412-693(+)
MSEFEMQGYLQKRTNASDGHSKAKRLQRQASAAVLGEWNRRYFVLSQGSLQYWQTKEEHDAGKPGNLCEPLQLHGYEMPVDTSDPGFPDDVLI